MDVVRSLGGTELKLGQSGKWPKYCVRLDFTDAQHDDLPALKFFP
jgi:hypothetical protein